MAKNLFFTGAKHIGKSTLINKLLAACPQKAGGFRTVRTDSVYDGRFSVHLVDISKGDKPSAANLLFFCDEADASDTARRFDALGAAALESAAGADIIVMDELGAREDAAERFKSAVLRALDGVVPVIGVLQRTNSAFLDGIASREDTVTVEVTEENRDMLPETYIRMISPER